MKRKWLPGILLLQLWTMVSPAWALATEKADIVAGLNALPLLINKITGDTDMAIIYDPADPASRQDAENIKKDIDAGMNIEGGKLSAFLVNVHELGKLSRARIAFLTPGLATHYTDIGTATAAASILTFTTDIDCVRLGQCIIGIVTRPGLTIYYSKAAADSAKLEFSQAFSMLVRQP